MDTTPAASDAPIREMCDHCELRTVDLDILVCFALSFVAPALMLAVALSGLSLARALAVFGPFVPGS